ILLVLSLTADKKVPTDVLATELALAGREGKDVDAIEFERPDAGTLLIVRTDKDRNTWQIQKPITAGADASRVLATVNALMAAKPIPYTGITSNPAVHGLDPAGLKVTLRSGDKSSTINLGDVTLGDKGVVFVTTSSQPKRPMAVRRSDLAAMFRETKDGSAGALAKWTADYRTSSIFPSDARAVGEDVTAVRLELPNKKHTLALTHTASGAWKFDSPANWGDADVEGDVPSAAPGTFTGVRRLLGALTSVTVTNPADFIDTPKDLKEYGLNADNPDLVKVELKTRDNQSATVYFGKRDAAPAAGGKVYLRVEGQPGVIHATAGDLSGLTSVIADPSPLRDRTLVRADRTKVDGIDIALPGQPLVKLRRGSAWQLYGGPNDPHPAHFAAVEKLLDVVLAPRTIKDFPAPNPAHFSAIAATVSVWVDAFLPPSGNAEPAPKGKPEPIKLEFGNRAGDVVYVRRTLPGQPPSEFALPTQIKVGAGVGTVEVLASVTKSRLDLRDPSLPSFSDTDRVTVTGVNNYALVRDEKPAAATKEPLWRFAPSDPRKGQIADGETVRNQLIYTLANANAAFGQFINEDPKPEQLKGYGLAPARLKVVADLPPGTEPKQVGFEFGADYPSDPDKVYARVVGRPGVFTLQRRVFERFAAPDLRDRVVFRGVPAPAVNKVELRGWGTAGYVTELAFEKNKEGAWVATKAPPGYAVDPVKLNTFLDVLTHERVKTFEKGGFDAKHGFADPKQALQVTLHWPGGIVSLNIGASPDNGATYFGSSSWMPRDEPVFTLEGAQLKPFKEGPGGFAKFSK
ncbi:MAG TPA: DUF4340 domain-containing protein, partial [Gemmata sp.]